MEPQLFPSLNTLNKVGSDRILRTFEDIHNHIYANDGLSAQQAFYEILKVLFIKIYDEKRNKIKAFFISSGEHEAIKNGRPAKEFTSRIINLQKTAFGFFSDVFDVNERISLKVGSLAYIVNKLESLNLSNSSNDVKGLAFQKFVFSKQRSDRGQFFTPEQIVDLCVQFLRPTSDDRILDPACGTGGFLSKALQYVLTHDLQKSKPNAINEFITKNIYGFEINNMVAKVAKLRMILEADGFANLVNGDTLSDEGMSKYEGQFDIILTNPPFGSQGKISDKAILKNYDLAFKWHDKNGSFIKSSELLNGQVPDILFLEKCISLLKDEGKLAIVIPNGDLENSSLDYVRNYLLNTCKVLAVVKLPYETFIPFGTGVKASVIFLQKFSSLKLESIKRANYSIFFGTVTKIGYKGNKTGSLIYKKDKDGNELITNNGDGVIDEDVSILINKYYAFLKSDSNVKTDNQCFSIKHNDLHSRLDVDFYDPTHKKTRVLLEAHGAKKLGEVIEIIKRKSRLFEDKNNVVEYVELSDVNADYYEIVNSTSMLVSELPSRAAFELKEGDIITAIAGNSIGTRKHATALVTSEYDGAICTNGFRILKATGLNPYYLLYYLRSSLFLNQVDRFRTGAAIPAISDSDLCEILIYLPTEEQQRKVEKMVKESFSLRNQSKQLLGKVQCIPKELEFSSLLASGPSFRKKTKTDLED